ncbi:hypothetical protein BHECKSOX_533 [Bathymodiolus heckerae thiotrophic gill symbiont]|uniref:hypothetical protein n=1 Tax=Bathymodiolus heckerae thiotrophic gill symbiont TaxID=1052212 RepID=UPI0010B844D1|nr:hypothetical protein [Bathymodiolus heckerae thiotrophic gill symbiont]SHN90344.1 hypothetical protein BHECKSOX_533 [Bathymodiolus heckerae thiotrophic gill symbiont]
MFNKLSLCFMVILMSGCVTPIFNIKTSTPAYIEVNGEIVCNKTPCKITPPHYVRGFGECATGSRMKSTIMVFPLDKSKGLVQHKNVYATCDNNKSIYFDMDVNDELRKIQLVE